MRPHRRDALDVAVSRRCRSTQVHLIEDTCVAASKEAALEKALSKMEGNWADAEFGTKEWRTGRILAGIDEIQQELDDQIVKTQVLTQRLFLKFSELQVRVDGVGATSRHRDAVDGAVRESTRLVREPRPCRDAVVRHRSAIWV